MHRVREFGDLRSSRESGRSNINQSSLSERVLKTPKRDFDRTSNVSSTQSFYVCTNCENLNMSAEKAREGQQRSMLERSRYQQLDKSRKVYDQHLRQIQDKKLQEEKQNMASDNNRMVQAHNQAKERERRAIETERAIQLSEQRENKKLAELQTADKERQVNELRSSLEKQIGEKNQKRLRQQMEQRYQQPVDFSEDQKNMELSRRRLDGYKEDLLLQIRQKEDKQRQDKLREDENGKTTFALMQLAEERARQMLVDDNKRKMKYQQEIRDLTKSTEKKRQSEQAKIEQERMQAKVNRQFEEKQFLEHEKVRVDRINKYKDDIKKQIQDKQGLRTREKLNDKYSSSYLNLSYQEVMKRLCDSCDKTYPKNYMTRYRRKKNK